MTSLQEELTVGEMYMRLDQSFRDKTHAFTEENTAELEAHFQAQFQAKLHTELQTRLEADIAHFFIQQPDLHPAVI